MYNPYPIKDMGKNSLLIFILIIYYICVIK
nr:MAG TPA: hypothetical protein [Caudoviricetes sp.]